MRQLTEHITQWIENLAVNINRGLTKEINEELESLRMGDLHESVQRLVAGWLAAGFAATDLVATFETPAPKSPQDIDAYLHKREVEALSRELGVDVTTIGHKPPSEPEVCDDGQAALAVYPE